MTSDAFADARHGAGSITYGFGLVDFCKNEMIESRTQILGGAAFEHRIEHRVLRSPRDA